ncbi:hypothetical protein KEM52_004821 [Ascosphaera acerosa]|nr:hypothetical protein KEM52_004821 [Ascosphaera acerosa]
MPKVLLPATAAAYLPRSPPQIILHDPVESWLTATLRTSLRVKKPLSKTYQHRRFLTELLGSERATWLLCSVCLPNASTAASLTSASASVAVSDATAVPQSQYTILHIEAYVVHIDTVSSPQEMTFKLTQKTIDALIDFWSTHGFVSLHADDDAAGTEWSAQGFVAQDDKDEFAAHVNRFVFRTDIHALEGMGEEGDGELLEGRAEKARRAIEALFLKPQPAIKPSQPLAQSESASAEVDWSQPEERALAHETDDVWMTEALSPAAAAAARTPNYATGTTVTKDGLAHVSMMETPMMFLPSSPPSSFTAQSPFSSPPACGAGGLSCVPDFSLDGASAWGSPSPPPSRRPQTFQSQMSPLARFHSDNNANPYVHSMSGVKAQAQTTALSSALLQQHGPLTFGSPALSADWLSAPEQGQQLSSAFDSYSGPAPDQHHHQQQSGSDDLWTGLSAGLPETLDPSLFQTSFYH